MQVEIFINWQQKKSKISLGLKIYERAERLISPCFYIVSNFAINVIRALTETGPIHFLKHILNSSSIIWLWSVVKEFLSHMEKISLPDISLSFLTCSLPVFLSFLLQLFRELPKYVLIFFSIENVREALVKSGLKKEKIIPWFLGEDRQF